jgi:multidrug efflux pump subunit AcrA (membrane-fusion protein)
MSNRIKRRFNVARKNANLRSNGSESGSYKGTVQTETTTATHRHDSAIDATLQVASNFHSSNLLRDRKQKRHRKFIVSALFIVVLVICGWMLFATLFAAPQEVSLNTDKVKVGTYENHISGAGTLIAHEQVSITPEITGTITEIKVAEGDMVEEGELLFTVYNADIDQQAQISQLSLKSAIIAYDGAIENLDNTMKMAENAWKTYEDTKARTEAARTEAKISGAVFDESEAQKELDTAYNNAQSADSAISSAQREVDAVAIQVEEAEINCNEATALLDKRNVRAPISGQIVAQNIEQGMNAMSLSESGESLMKIVDCSKMIITLNINEIDILKLAEGQPASVTFSALPEYVATATVMRISPIDNRTNDDISSNTNANSVAYYPVEILIEQPNQQLKIGMSAMVKIMVNRFDNVLIVNSLAVQVLNGENIVYKQDSEGNMTPVEITIIDDNGIEAVVEGKLEEGDIIVLTSIGIS